MNILLQFFMRDLFPKLHYLKLFNKYSNSLMWIVFLVNIFFKIYLNNIQNMFFLKVRDIYNTRIFYNTVYINTDEKNNLTK